MSCEVSGERASPASSALGGRAWTVAASAGAGLAGPASSPQVGMLEEVALVRVRGRGGGGRGEETTFRLVKAAADAPGRIQTQLHEERYLGVGNLVSLDFAIISYLEVALRPWPRQQVGLYEHLAYALQVPWHVLHSAHVQRVQRASTQRDRVSQVAAAVEQVFLRLLVGQSGDDGGHVGGVALVVSVVGRRAQVRILFPDLV